MRHDFYAIAERNILNYIRFYYTHPSLGCQVRQVSQRRQSHADMSYPLPSPGVQPKVLQAKIRCGAAFSGSAPKRWETVAMPAQSVPTQKNSRCNGGMQRERAKGNARREKMSSQMVTRETVIGSLPISPRCLSDDIIHLCL